LRRLFYGSKDDTCPAEVRGKNQRGYNENTMINKTYA